MADKRSSIIVTGASGFVGRHFLETAKEHYLIYAMARRSQNEAGVARHPNIKWIQVDIGNWPKLKKIMQRIKALGGADFMLHLAAYYDFTNKDHIEYTRTNVNGMRHMLELAKWLCVKRFIFASSLVVCSFPPGGAKITEQSFPDAEFPYARSKRKGEEMMRAYSEWFPCSVVRLAAVFSDWCEYPPLYMFLCTWLSKRWNARILGGKGESAVPYIHIHDLNDLFTIILEKSTTLPSFDIYNASPDGSTTHFALFEMVTRYHFGHTVKALFLPKAIAYPGVIMRNLLGRALGKRPFEQPWMLKYLDRRLDVDSFYTRQTLNWSPTPRYHVIRRLLFLVEKMKSHPVQWQLRNEAALKHSVERPCLKIYETLSASKDALVAKITNHIHDPLRRGQFGNYQKMERADLQWYVGIIYQMLMATVRNGDRTLMLQYAYDIGVKRFEEGFEVKEICALLMVMNDVVISELHARPELRGLEEDARDFVTLSIQLANDGIEDAYEQYSRQKRSVEDIPGEQKSLQYPRKHLERIISQLDVLYWPAGKKEREPMQNNRLGSYHELKKE